jgi:hypothetical protein
MANLSGTWLGTYWQYSLPTRFEMSLLQGGNSLSGNSLDNGGLGEAILSGEVQGRSVQFTKQYVMHRYYSIVYEGTVSEDEKLMSEDEKLMRGQWWIGQESGEWEARRGGEDLLQELMQKKDEKKILTVGRLI